MADDFTSTSRDLWQNIRSGTSYEQLAADTGPYTAEFYGVQNGENIRVKELVNYILKEQQDDTLIFNWEEFAATDIVAMRPSETAAPSVHSGQTWFTYTNENKQVIQTYFSGRLNKRIDYLENASGYIISINASEETISATLQFYYVNTKQFRQDVPETATVNDFTINDKYVTIEMTSENLTDFCYLIKTIYGDTNFQAIQKRISEKIADQIKKETTGKNLNFLYKNIPDFAYSYLREIIEPTLIFKHLDSLKTFDDNSWFSDSSNAIVNLLKVLGKSETIYNEFYNSPVLVKQLYQNLDGISIYQGTTIKNRLVFADLIWMLCANQKYANFEKAEDIFYIGKNFKLDSNVLAFNDVDQEKVFLRQYEGKQEKETIVIPDDLPSKTERITINTTKFYPKDGGVYYHPLFPVYLVDADSKEQTMYIVPALYVKALSDEAEWKDINLSIRIGVDVLAVILSIATLGAATPLLTALAIVDITIASVDVGVALGEDELMKSPEGQKFLENWNKIVLAGGAITALPLIGTTITAGAKLFSLATVEVTKIFLRASVLRLVMEIEIAGFVKNTLKVLEPREIYQSVEFLNGADRLWKGGVVFIEGTSTVEKNKTVLAAMYNGEIIAQGTKLEIADQLKNIWKLEGEALATALEDTYGLKKIDDAVQKLNIKITVPKNMLSGAESSTRLGNIVKTLSRDKRLVFNPAKQALKELKIKLPKSKTGLSVDFAGSPYLYPAKEGERAIVKIKLTGSRRVDDRLAFDLAEIKPDVNILNSYTWHHLDDYDPISGTCTLQLVESKIHTACCPHYGAVSLLERFFNIKYK